MEAIDGAKTAVSEATQQLADLEAAGPGNLSEIDTRREGADAPRRQLVVSRAGACAGIEPPRMKRYQPARSSTRAPGCSERRFATTQPAEPAQTMM